MGKIIYLFEIAIPLIVLAVLWWAIYFKIAPWLIAYYKKHWDTRLKYDKQINNIRERK